MKLILKLLAATTAVLALTACRAELPLESRTQPDPDVERDTRSWQRVDDRLSHSACVIASTVGGHAATRVVAREHLPLQMPQFDSVQYRGTSKPVLTVATVRIPDVAGGAGLVVRCLGSYDLSFQTALFKSARSSDPGRWRSLVGEGGWEDATEAGPLEVLAAKRLMKEIFPGAQQASAPSPPASTLAAMLGTGPDGSTLARADTNRAQPLGPVTITASRTAYVIDTYWLYSTLRRTFSFSDFINFAYWYTDGPNCAEASELYLADQAEIQKMEDYKLLLEGVSEPLANYVCERNSARPVCVDFFISADRAAVFGGDNRTFDPDAGYRASRVQLYFNPTTLEWEVKINSTRKYDWFGPGYVEKSDSARLFRSEDVKIYRDANGYTVLELKVFNNFCLSRATCPAIDAKLWLENDPAAAGGFEVYWKRDGFPSMAVQRLKADGSGWDVMVQDRELIKNHITNWWALTGMYKSSSKMPPGCTLQ